MVKGYNIVVWARAYTVKESLRDWVFWLGIHTRPKAIKKAKNKILELESKGWVITSVILNQEVTRLR